MKRSMLLAVVFMVVIFIGYSNQAYPKEEVITLKIANHHGPTHLNTISLQEAYGPLEKMSGGRIKVRFFPGGALVKDREVVDAVLGGVADIGHLSIGYWPGRFPLSLAAELPGLFPNAAIGTRVLMELIKTSPLIEKEFGELKLLGLFTSSPYPLMLKEKITTIAQIKGLRLRTAGGLQTPTLEKFGAVPVMMGSGEIYTSLERGLVAGAPFPLASQPPYRFYEICKYVAANLLFGPVLQGDAMNKSTWAKLPPDIQAMVAECGKNRMTLAAQFYDIDDRLAVSFLQTKGVEVYNISPAEEEKFYSALKPLQDEWVADIEKKVLPGKGLLNSLLDIRKKHIERWK